MNITHLDDLTYDYTQIADPNTRTLGTLVPLDELEKIAVAVW